MLYKTRPYAPMKRNDIARIQDAGRRVKALDGIVQRSLHNNLRTTAMLAQRQAEEIRKEIYQSYDVRL